MHLIPVVVILAATGFAQSRVLDPAKAVVRDTRVTLTHSGSGAIQESKSDALGEFVFASLAPGRYTVRVDAQGFATVSRAAGNHDSGELGTTSGKRQLSRRRGSRIRPQAGHFRLHGATTGETAVIGNGVFASSTARALERLGYRVTSSPSADVTVEIFDEDGCSSWISTRGGVVARHRSIEELSTELVSK